jgi:hypothetical protein
VVDLDGLVGGGGGRGAAANESINCPFSLTASTDLPSFSSFCSWIPIPLSSFGSIFILLSSVQATSPTTLPSSVADPPGPAIRSEEFCVRQ